MARLTFCYEYHWRKQNQGPLMLGRWWVVALVTAGFLYVGVLKLLTPSGDNAIVLFFVAFIGVPVAFLFFFRQRKVEDLLKRRPSGYKMPDDD